MFARRAPFIFFVFLALHSASCMDRDKGKKPSKAKNSQTQKTSPPSAASALGSPDSEGEEETIAPPKRKAFENDNPILSYAGFSKDGSRFAYAYKEPRPGAVAFLWTAEAGVAVAKAQISLDPEYLDSLKEAEAFIKEGSYDPKREKPPEGLNIKADLLASPPTVTLSMGKKKSLSEVGQKPYPENFIAILWGLSPDKKSVAIAIGEAPKGMSAAPDAGMMGASLPVNALYRVAKLPE